MRTLHSNGVVLRMAKYTWKIAWLKHYNAISPVPRNIGQNDKKTFYKSIVAAIIKALSLQPSNHIWKSHAREYLSLIEDYIAATRNRLLQDDPQSSHDDIIEPLARTVLPGIMTLVAWSTRISFGLIMHLISARLKQASSVITMFETTTELLQCIVIQLVSPCSQKRLFRGDLHTCQLHCTRCGRSFGIVDTLEKVLANAQLSILTHYGLSIQESTNTHDYLFRQVLPPIFANPSNLSLAVR